LTKLEPGSINRWASRTSRME